MRTAPFDTLAAKREKNHMGIKETLEALVGVNEVAILLATRLKDWVGVDDFAAVWEKLQNDAEFKAKLEAAYNGVAQVPTEIKDLEISEVVTLVMTQAAYVPKLVEALKK